MLAALKLLERNYRLQLYCPPFNETKWNLDAQPLPPLPRASLKRPRKNVLLIYYNIFVSNAKQKDNGFLVILRKTV